MFNYIGRGEKMVKFYVVMSKERRDGKVTQEVVKIDTFENIFRTKRLIVQIRLKWSQSCKFDLK